jgi:hypothetical protein
MMSLNFKKSPAPPRQFQKSGPVVLPAVAEMLDPLRELATGLQARKETMPQLHIHFIINPEEECLVHPHTRTGTKTTQY